MVRKDRLLAMVLVAFCVVGLLLTRGYPKEAAYYPRAVFLLIIALSIFLYVKADPDQMVNAKGIVCSFFTDRKLMSVILATLIMIALMNYVGLYFELPFFIIGVMYCIGYRNKKTSAIIAISLTLVIYLLFTVLLHIRIPLGFWVKIF